MTGPSMRSQAALLLFLGYTAVAQLNPWPVLRRSNVLNEKDTSSQGFRLGKQYQTWLNACQKSGQPRQPISLDGITHALDQSSDISNNTVAAILESYGFHDQLAQLRDQLSVIAGNENRFWEAVAQELAQINSQNTTVLAQLNSLSDVSALQAEILAWEKPKTGQTRDEFLASLHQVASSIKARVQGIMSVTWGTIAVSQLLVILLTLIEVVVIIFMAIALVLYAPEVILEKWIKDLQEKVGFPIGQILLGILKVISAIPLAIIVIGLLTLLCLECYKTGQTVCGGETITFDCTLRKKTSVMQCQLETLMTTAVLGIDQAVDFLAL